MTNDTLNKIFGYLVLLMITHILAWAKIEGVLEIGWTWVFAPLWIPVAIGVMIGVLWIIVTLVSAVFKDK